MYIYTNLFYLYILFFIEHRIILRMYYMIDKKDNLVSYLSLTKQVDIQNLMITFGSSIGSAPPCHSNI